MKNYNQQYKKLREVIQAHFKSDDALSKPLIFTQDGEKEKYYIDGRLVKISLLVKTT